MTGLTIEKAMSAGPSPQARGLVLKVIATKGTGTAAAHTLLEFDQPKVGQLVKQLPLVQSWAELREERAAEVLAQIDNQVAFLGAVTGLNATKHRWTMEWLNAGLQLAIAVEMRFKHAFACARPCDLSQQVQPIITTPLHGTYPMGHCVQAFLVAYALQRLIGWGPAHPGTTQLQRQAARISINRVVAGVHFPVDAIGGQRMGQSLAEYFVARSGFTDAVFYPRSLLSTELQQIADKETDYGSASVLAGQANDALKVATRSDILEAMAKLARAEWDPDAMRIPEGALPAQKADAEV
jgi:hypothetical protein